MRCVNGYGRPRNEIDRRGRAALEDTDCCAIYRQERGNEWGRNEGCNEISSRTERKREREREREDFLKLHFVAPERPYTGISTPTARDNEASTGAAAFAEVREAHRWVRTSQRAAHGDIIDIREE